LKNERTKAGVFLLLSLLVSFSEEDDRDELDTVGKLGKFKMLSLEYKNTIIVIINNLITTKRTESWDF